MTKRVVALLAVAVLAGLPAASVAQQKEIPRVRIDKVRLGFPMLPQQGGAADGFKVGSWTPVYIDLVAGKSRVGSLDAVVTVSAEDNGDMETLFHSPIPPMEPDESPTMVSYFRTAKSTGDIVVTLTLADGRVVSREKISPRPYAPSAFFYLQAGVRDNGMKTALRIRSMPPGQQQPKDEDDLSRDDGHGFAYASSVAELPTRWFGYGTVDVVLLHTGRDDKFVQELLDDRTNRKEALVEWVRRGGRLVVSVGRNQQLAGKLLEAMQIIDCQVTGLTTRQQMTETANRFARAGNLPFVGLPVKDMPNQFHPVDIAKIENIGPSVDVLITEPEDAQDPVKRPVMIQAGCGLGRVVLAAFDMEVGPFRAWTGRPFFWGQLQSMIEAPQTKGGVAENPQNYYPGSNSNNELASRMYGKLDHFDEVPVVSFGWVALFILIYIIVVGPLDYLFLTKVVKRPELTWITFPAVVIVISAIAYFTAYWLKGRDLRINKFDFVDIVAEVDPATGSSQSTAVYGNTWFTLFSPRIQNYTVGVEPNAGPKMWAPRLPISPNTKKDPYSPLVSWFARADDAFGGTGGSSAPSLFRRAYEYAPDASGLKGVPIQVWTTKSFQASWQSAIPEDAPLITSNINLVGDKLSGSIHSELPVVLEDLTIFYKDQAYALGTKKLEIGPNPVEALMEKAQGQALSQWYQDAKQLGVNYGYNYDYNGKSVPSNQPAWSQLIKPLMFHDNFNDNTVRSSLLKPLDQSWRLKRTDEVILVGRAAPVGGPATLTSAEAVTENPFTVTKLWLGALPQDGGQRPSLDGKMNQETYVRLFLPVKTPAKKPMLPNP